MEPFAHSLAFVVINATNFHLNCIFDFEKIKIKLISKKLLFLASNTRMRKTCCCRYVDLFAPELESKRTLMHV